jgi:hypothetical protein
MRSEGEMDQHAQLLSLPGEGTHRNLREGRVAKDPELSLQRTLALERFKAFRFGELGMHEVFDVEDK